MADAGRWRALIRLGAVCSATVAGRASIVLPVVASVVVAALGATTIAIGAGAPRTALAQTMPGGAGLGSVAGSVAGSATRGAEAYEARCTGCHSVAADRVGPRHAGVFGRKAGSVPGFDYSPALAKSGVVWNAQTLERWLSNPEGLVPGQRMGYQLGDPQIRADVIAYLATLKVTAP